MSATEDLVREIVALLQSDDTVRRIGRASSECVALLVERRFAPDLDDEDHSDDGLVDRRGDPRTCDEAIAERDRLTREVERLRDLLNGQVIRCGELQGRIDAAVSHIERAPFSRSAATAMRILNSGREALREATEDAE